jgi:membrane protease YdiL (CAAX protease family)
VLALFGALLVDIPAAVLGTRITGTLPPGLQIADTFVQDAAFVGAAVILAGWGGRSVRAWQFGLRPTGIGRALLGVVALYAGFFAFSVAWQLALNLHGKEKLLDQLGANRNAALLVGSATLTCVVAPICEEFLFRGYMFTALRNWRGPWPAALITGLLFGGVHATSAPAAYLVPLAALGVGLCLLYWRTRSLYPCIAAHCVNNCIAFGSLENWGWQIPVLMACSLGGIALLFGAAHRRGLLAAPVALAGA